MYSSSEEEDKEKEVYKVMRYFFIFLMCGILLASCSSKKNLERASGGNIVLAGEAQLADVVKMLNAKRVAEPSLAAKINMNLSAGSKDVRLGGSLKMKRNDVIQLSLVAFGLMEVGKLEMTPDYMMVIDRMNRQYVKCAYTDVDFFKVAGIDFYTFQSLFWDELFVLGGKGEVPTASDYSLKEDGNIVLSENEKERGVALTFIVNVAKQLVSETRFSKAGTDVPVLKWTYDEWTKQSDGYFPGIMKITFALPKETVEAVLKLSSVKPDSNWETRTEINKNKYSEVSLQAALKRIMSLAE